MHRDDWPRVNAALQAAFAPEGEGVFAEEFRLFHADGTAVIDKGLEAGQRVVVDGQYKLKPGATIVEPPPAAKSAVKDAVKDAAKVASSSGSSN